MHEDTSSEKPTAVDFNEEFDHLVWQFQSVTFPDAHVAWSLSGALHSLDLATTRKDSRQITAEQRDKLLSAVVAAHAQATDRLPGKIAPPLIDEGMRAVAGIVMTWAESEEERAERHSHVYPDMRAYARLLRNMLHNASLVEEICGRQATRQRETRGRHQARSDGVM